MATESLGGTAPKFRDLEELNRFIALVMGFYNDLVLCFEVDSDNFRPTFYEHKHEGRRIVIVDEWCVGFLKGMRLDAAAWRPLKKERPELLKPIELFGSKAGLRELEAGGDEKMHRRWSPKIAPAVRDVYRYWLPFREAQFLATSGERVHWGRATETCQLVRSDPVSY